MEADFIVSGKAGKGILLTVVCRKLRVVLLELILDVSIDEVHAAFLKIKKRFPEMKTVTLDNDILFKMHKTLEQLLQVKIYFCHPYHSWEKGSVENAIGRLRRYVPKGESIDKVSPRYLKAIQDKLNHTPRKCLNYLTPYEKLQQLLSQH